MNVIGYAQPSFPRAPRHRFHRVETITLASSISIVALLVATALHTLAGVDEVPLVIGTILVASVAGWINAYLPTAAATPGDGGRDLDREFDADLDLEFDAGWYDRAA